MRKLLPLVLLAACETHARVEVASQPTTPAADMASPLKDERPALLVLARKHYYGDAMTTTRIDTMRQCEQARRALSGVLVGDRELCGACIPLEP